MWQKKESKLELAASMIRQVMPEFHSKDHIIILCDSWYTKQNLVSIVDEYSNLDLIGNARIDSVMYEHGTKRLFFSTIFPEDLQIVCAWQEKAPLNQPGSDRMKYIPLLL